MNIKKIIQNYLGIDTLDQILLTLKNIEYNTRPITTGQEVISEKRVFKKITRSELYYFCINSIGNNFCSNYSYGGAETINNIFITLTGKPICEGNSTSQIYWFLQNDKERFIEISDPLPGDIIISPTSFGKNEEYVGNVGIIGDNSSIFSTGPDGGKIVNELFISDWINKYQNLGFPIKFFRLI